MQHIRYNGPSNDWSLQAFYDPKTNEMILYTAIMSHFPAQSLLWFNNNRHYNLSGDDSSVKNSDCHSNYLPTRE
jgi:hypothetical protein